MGAASESLVGLPSTRRLAVLLETSVSHVYSPESLIEAVRTTSTARVPSLSRSYF